MAGHIEHACPNCGSLTCNGRSCYRRLENELERLRGATPPAGAVFPPMSDFELDEVRAASRTAQVMRLLATIDKLKAEHAIVMCDGDEDHCTREGGLCDWHHDNELYEEALDTIAHLRAFHSAVITASVCDSGTGDFLRRSVRAALEALPLEIALPRRCDHRDYLDGDVVPSGERCEAIATHTVCTPSIGVVCEKHKCRCSRPL